MTLLELKAAAAAYLERNTDDLTVNSVDLGLIALNQVRLKAQLDHDFEFTRKLVTVEVNSVVGGSLDVAVEYGTTNTVLVGTIVDVGLFDSVTGELRPVEWTTVAEGLSREREENPYATVRYPSDSQAESGPFGQRRFVFSGSRVFFFPRPKEPITFTLGVEAYTLSPDWVAEDLINEIPPTDPWLTKGHQYLLWAVVIQLNHLYKGFVFRQEGNLPPPKELADAGLASLISWDIFRYEQTRRHGR